MTHNLWVMIYDPKINKNFTLPVIISSWAKIPLSFPFDFFPADPKAAFSCSPAIEAIAAILKQKIKKQIYFMKL